METPWEPIIKIYRKQLGNNCFPKLTDYQEDFILFLRSKDFFSDDNTKIAFVQQFFFNILQGLNNETFNLQGKMPDVDDIEKPNVLNTLISKAEQWFSNWQNTNPLQCNDFIDLLFEDFKNFNRDIIDNVVQVLYQNGGFLVNQNQKMVLEKLLYETIKMQEVSTPFTGLVFAGFGEDDIFPSLIPVNISFALGDRLRYFVDINMTTYISNNNNASIRPFAQTDVINTILTGIAPNLEQTYISNFDLFLKQYNQILATQLQNTQPELAQQILNLDVRALVQQFIQENHEVKKTQYINPLMNAVSMLSKEDLSEMAESLIYLTYLKRRITFAEESVGGPVDVAVISKGDGFIWMKRKHYFKPELNQHFFINYNKI